MAKVTVTVEDTLEGVSLDIRHEPGRNMREHARMTPAQQLAEQLHYMASMEMKLDSLPAHCKQCSNTVH